MLPIQVMLIAGGLAAAYWLGGSVVHGVKKAEHAVAGKLHRHHEPKPETRPESRSASESESGHKSRE